MNTEIECGGCPERLSIEHWKQCGRVQCKCVHDRRKHNKYGGCKQCRCAGFEPLLKFDDYYGWSKSVKPEIIYKPDGKREGVKI